MASPPGGLNSPIGKSSKWSTFRTPDRQRPPTSRKAITMVALEKTFNPATQAYTDNFRLGVSLKAGLKNPKGFVEAAWAAAALGEKPWFAWFGGRAPRANHPR